MNEQPIEPSTRVAAELRGAQWRGETLVLTCWAWWNDRDGVGVAIPRLSVHREGHVVSATTVVLASTEAVVTRQPRDHVDICVFEAHVPASALAAGIAADRVNERSYDVAVGLRDDLAHGQGPLDSRHLHGSAGSPGSQVVEPGVVIRPYWDDTTGLKITVARRAVLLRDVVVGDGELTLALDTVPGFEVDSLWLSDGDGEPVLDLTWDPRASRATIYRTALTAIDGGPHHLTARHADVRRRVHWAPGGLGGVLGFGDRALVNGPSGVVSLVGPGHEPIVSSCVIDADSATARFEGHALGSRLVAATLTGTRDTLPGRIATQDGIFTVDVPLVAPSRWSGTDVAPVSGGYDLQLVDDRSIARTPTTGAAMSSTLDATVSTPWATVQVERGPHGVPRLAVRPPLDPAERGRRNQDRLGASWAGATPHLLDNIYFESFIGEFAACSPRAIHDEVRRRNLPFELVWGVKDHSVATPEGTRAVVIGSRDWWEAKQRSRYLVTNDWLHGSYPRRPGQVAVQTWHGTAFKRLGLDRPGQGAKPGFAHAVRAESARWDYLVVQNEHSADVMASAYEYAGTVLRTGLPRNDVLSSAAADGERQRLRTELGVGDRVAVLYAPTWRDDLRAVESDLDLSALAAALGPGHCVLARGHSLLLRADRDRSTDSVVDVTTFPDAARLFLAADVVITDYSSVMFDLTITGKPLLFHVPDLQEYAGTKRGAYFDLEVQAPGPLLRELPEVADAVLDLSWRTSYADRYAAWQARYDPWDDGSASARVVDEVFGIEG